MDIETILQRLVKNFGGELCTKGDWKRATGMEKPRANSLSAQLQLRHFQVRGVFQEKGGETWMVMFR